MATGGQIFHAISRDQFTRIQAAVKDQTGIAISGDVGDASKSGCTIGWSYDEGEQSLQVTVLKTPFLVPAGVVLNKISALVKETA